MHRISCRYCSYNVDSIQGWAWNLAVSFLCPQGRWNLRFGTSGQPAERKGRRRESQNAGSARQWYATDESIIRAITQRIASVWERYVSSGVHQVSECRHRWQDITWQRTWVWLTVWRVYFAFASQQSFLLLKVNEAAAMLNFPNV